MSAGTQALTVTTDSELKRLLETGLSTLAKGYADETDVQPVFEHAPALVDWLQYLQPESAINSGVLPWEWQSYIDDQKLRIGVLQVTPGSPVPPHDHPGSSGLLIALAGKLRIREYKVTSTGKRSVEMSLANEQLIVAGEFACYGSQAGNVHHTEAVNEGCLVLDVVIRPYGEAQRTWFMPKNEAYRHMKRFDAVRIRRQQ